MVAEEPQLFVTDAEALQELVHRYLASGRWSLGREVLRDFGLAILNRIEPVYADDIHSAGQLPDRNSGISTQDLVHAGVMQRMGIDRIISADTDFDRLAGINRLDPTHIGEWESSILIIREN